MNIARQIEDKIIADLKLQPYIINNNIPVLEFRNNMDPTGLQAIIHANSEKKSLTDEKGRAKEWGVQVDFLMFVHNAESSIPENEFESLYEFLYSYMLNFQKNTITLSNLIINGINEIDSDESFDERFNEQHCSMILYCEPT
jgi:hypothetical protein